MTTTPVPSDVPTESAPRQRALIRTPTCLHCGYLLEGVPDGRCPECGHEMVFESPDASGRRMACGRFGGPWRYARAVMYGIPVLFLAEIVPWHWELKSLGWGIAVLLFLFGILSVVAGWSAALLERCTIRTPIFSAVSDLLQWLQMIPILGILSIPVAFLLDGTVEMRFRYVNQSREFFFSVAIIILMAIGTTSLLIVKLRWPAVARHCGLPEFAMHSHAVQKIMRAVNITVLCIAIFIILVFGANTMTIMNDLR